MTLKYLAGKDMFFLDVISESYMSRKKKENESKLQLNFLIIDDSI